MDFSLFTRTLKGKSPAGIIKADYKYPSVSLAVYVYLIRIAGTIKGGRRMGCPMGRCVVFEFRNTFGIPPTRSGHKSVSWIWFKWTDLVCGRQKSRRGDETGLYAPDKRGTANIIRPFPPLDGGRRICEDLRRNVVDLVLVWGSLMAPFFTFSSPGRISIPF